MTNESAGENTTATTASKTTGSSETQVASGRNSFRNSNVRRLLLEVARKSYIQAHNAWVTSLPPVTATAPQSGDLIGLGFGTRRNYTESASTEQTPHSSLQMPPTPTSGVPSTAASTSRATTAISIVCPTALKCIGNWLIGVRPPQPKPAHNRTPSTALARNTALSFVAADVRCTSLI